ncbi:MAG: hypothetical protein K2N51_10090 [Lachnospiraceae bacterium]|nr:hypothetical protein [Lachnospiraceae bacterium]
MRLKCRQFKALFFYDLSNGFQRNQWKWLFALLLQIYYCILAGNTGVLGRFTSLFEGQYELQLSTQWLTFHGFLLFLVNFYPVNELTYNGGQAIIRSGRKEYWLFSKMMWIISTVISYYLLLVLVLVIGSVFTGSFSISPDVMMEIFEIDITGLNLTKIILYWWGMPLLVSIALCITEAILSLFIQPVISLFIMFAYLIASAYCMNPAFLGNYAMLKRQDFTSGVLSISPQNCLISCMLLMIIAVTAGTLCFKRKDTFQLQGGE